MVILRLDDEVVAVFCILESVMVKKSRLDLGLAMPG